MLRTKSKQGAPAQDGSIPVSLMSGESVQASVGRFEGAGSRECDVLLLTDRRIIHVSHSNADNGIAIAALDDIGVVELTQWPAGSYGAFIWAALAFLVAFMLWRVIESQWLSVGAAVAVALMGVYLIVDRLMSRGERALVFRASGGELRVELTGAERQSEAETLTARLFELKEERASTRQSHASRFSPR